MTEMTPEIMRQYAEADEKMPAYIRGGMRAAASTWEADLAHIEALENYLFLVPPFYRQWGWNGSLPMVYGYCYDCGASRTEGHRKNCPLAALAAEEPDAATS